MIILIYEILTAKIRSHFYFDFLFSFLCLLWRLWSGRVRRTFFWRREITDGRGPLCRLPARRPPLHFWSRSFILPGRPKITLRRSRVYCGKYKSLEGFELFLLSGTWRRLRFWGWQSNYFQCNFCGAERIFSSSNRVFYSGGLAAGNPAGPRECGF